MSSVSTTGLSVAHTRRFDSVPSSPRSNAVSRPPSVSATISVRASGVMTVPFGNMRSSAATVAVAVGVDANDGRAGGSRRPP